MGPISSQEIERRIASLRQNYFAELPAKLAHVNQLWQAAKNDGAATDRIKSLHHAIHSLAGSGATFGIEKISALARLIETNLKVLLDESRPCSKNEQITLDELFFNLEQQATKQDQHDDTSELLMPEFEEKKQLIYVVEDDQHTANRLGIELLREKYVVEIFTELENFKQAFQRQAPAVIIMDIVFPESSEGGLETIDQLRARHGQLPPVIFISVRNDIVARLAAVKAGASRYFTKPIDHKGLLGTLDGLTNRFPRHPYRILIIDDDEMLSDYYSTLLLGAGMETMIVNDPLQALDKLVAYNPDLVLMDVYMPQCSGLELAAVIRQDDRNTALPIVFLSTEADLDKQLHAMDLGGDDFLTKPVLPAHLINAVAVRAKRARCLSRLHTDLELALLQNRQQRLEQEKNEERLRFSQMFANIGTWDLNIHSGRMLWSERVAPLLGYSEQAELSASETYAAFLNAIHPEDRQQVIAAISECTAGKSQFDVEHRVIWQDGSIRWIVQRGDVIRDQNGDPVRMLGVVLDTTHRKQLERDLATQKDLAEQANRAKSDFLSRMSHELRTPLNAIIGFTQLLESDTDQPLGVHQLDSIGEILSASNHLLELIDEVLDLSRIEAGKMKLKLEDIELMDILLECYSLMSPMAEVHRIQLDFGVEDCVGVKVRADRTRLRQVMLNLLSNAVKYNTENGRVSVQCDAFSLSRIRINVIDTGPGIPQQRQSELFEAFNRLGAETSEVEGTGIGLMITKRLTEMMGGELGFSSQAQQGSTFWLELIRTDNGAETGAGEDLQQTSGSFSC